MNPERATLARRFGSFSALPVLTLLPPLVQLPVVARAASTAEWVTIALAVSVGSVGALVSTCGWTITGPALVAKTDVLARPGLYRDAFRTQLVLLALALPAAVATVLALSPGGTTLLATVLTGAVVTSGLSPSWFSVAEGRPWDIAKFDLAPRLVGAIVSAAVVVATGEVLWYAAVSLLVSLVVPAWFLCSDRAGRPRQRPRRDLRKLLRHQASATAVEIVAAVYSSSSVALVASQATLSGTALYGAGIRLYQLTLQAVIALTRTLQAWVAQEGESQGDRMRSAIVAHLALGLSGLLGVTLVGPTVSGFVLGGDLAIPRDVAFWFGIAFAAVSLNTAMGRHVLAVSGRHRSLLMSTVAAAVVGVPTTLYLAATYGAAGGAAGLAVSEITACMWQLPGVVTLLRRAPAR